MNAGGAGSKIRPPKNFGTLLKHGDAFWSEGRLGSGYHDGKFLNRITSLKVGRLMDNMVFCYAKSPVDMAESMAFNPRFLGAVVWFEYGKPVIMHTDQPIPDSFRPYIQFYKDNRELFRQTKVKADIAILRNFPSQVFADDQYADLTRRVENTCMNSCIPYQIIYDDHLDHLEDYKVLALAGCVALSDLQIQKIREFVSLGGRLFILGSVATHNEWLKERAVSTLDDLPESQIVRMETTNDLYNSLNKSVNGTFSYEVSGPETLFVEYNEKEQQKQVHLVNYKPEVPAKKVKVKVQIDNGQTVKQVRLLNPEREESINVKFKKVDKGIVFTIPEVKLYEIAVIEL